VTERAEVDFVEFLEAKYAVDTISLHRRTLRRFVQMLSDQDLPVLVDLGTGTGAMIRRLAPLLPASRLRFVGVESDPGTLAAAPLQTAGSLAAAGYEVTQERQGLVACRKTSRSTQTVEVNFILGDLLDEQTHKRLSAERPAAVTAHALMDTVPLREATTLIRDVLPPGGLFYASMNYDGRTTLRPRFSQQGAETAMLDVYDQSMEDRKVRNLPVGGARSGARLLSVLKATDFTPISSGVSDWRLSVRSERRTPAVRSVMRSMLAIMYREFLVQRENGWDAVGSETIDEWFRERSERIEAGKLTIRVHQIDILARR